MNTTTTLILNFLLIALLSASISYAIMRWSFSPKRHAELAHKFGGMNIAGLNSGAIILLSLSIAFVFSDISSAHTRAKTSLFQEADALRTLGRLALNIDSSVGAPLMAATRDYTSSVLQTEWPVLQQGKPQAIRTGENSALRPLTVISDIVYSPENLTRLPVVTSMQLSTIVARIREQRLLRIDASEFSIGIRGLLLAGVTLLASSTLLSLAMLQKPSVQYLSNFFLYVVTLAALYLAYNEQNPFAGLDVVSSAPLQEALDRLINMQLTR
jgi:hypothetical protein